MLAIVLELDILITALSARCWSFRIGSTFFGWRLRSIRTTISHIFRRTAAFTGFVGLFVDAFEATLDCDFRYVWRLIEILAPKSASTVFERCYRETYNPHSS